MPHFWLPVPSNPKGPKRMRDETRDAVTRRGGTLIDDELFFKPGDYKTGFATVKCSAAAIREIAGELNAPDYERVLTADEAAARIRGRRKPRGR